MNYSVGRCELQNLGTTPQTHAAQGGYKVLCCVVLHPFHSRFSQFMSTYRGWGQRPFSIVS